MIKLHIRTLSALIVLLLCAAVLSSCGAKENAALPASDADIESVTDLTETDCPPADIPLLNLDFAEALIAENEKEPDSFTVQMGGDILFHDTVINASRIKKTNQFSVAPYFSEFSDVFVSDLNIVNLETPVDVNGGNKGIIGYPAFNMPYEVLPALKSIGVDLVTTATNHTPDKGYKGVCNTLKNVRKAGLIPVGTFETKEDRDKLCILEINGIKVGVASYTTYTNGSLPEKYSFAVNKCGYKYDAIVKYVVPQIKKLRENGAEFIIVAMHWGKEYEDKPDDRMKKTAKALCEAGADIIAGSHPHCIQPIEYLTVDRDGKESKALVIYSMGNLFANQTGLYKPKTQEAMIVSVKAQRDEDGKVHITDAFYTPTFSYVRGGKGDNYMRLICSGEFKDGDTRPGIFKDDKGWKTCKKAWTNVTNKLGTVIPCVASPKDYPEGFFDLSSTDLSSGDI